jgi:hypothetical protein
MNSGDPIPNAGHDGSANQRLLDWLNRRPAILHEGDHLNGRMYGIKKFD